MVNGEGDKVMRPMVVARVQDHFLCGWRVRRRAIAHRDLILTSRRISSSLLLHTLGTCLVDGSKKVE